MAERGVDAVWSGDDYEGFHRQLASDEPPHVWRTCAVYQETF